MDSLSGFFGWRFSRWRWLWRCFLIGGRRYLRNNHEGSALGTLAFHACKVVRHNEAGSTLCTREPNRHCLSPCHRSAWMPHNSDPTSGCCRQPMTHIYARPRANRACVPCRSHVSPRRQNSQPVTWAFAQAKTFLGNALRAMARLSFPLLPLMWQLPPLGDCTLIHCWFAALIWSRCCISA